MCGIAGLRLNPGLYPWLGLVCARYGVAGADHRGRAKVP
jgi:hypothetical protein